MSIHAKNSDARLRYVFHNKKGLILSFLMTLSGSAGLPSPAKAQSPIMSRAKVTHKKSTSPDPQAMAVMRKQWALALQGSYMEDGVDIHITTTGARNTHLTFTSSIIDEAAAARMANPTSFAMMKKMGFTKFTVADGQGASWSWDL